MKKQEALKRIEAQKETIIELTGWAVFRYIEALIEQLDEPETGHSDEAPRYVKNILARLRELPEHDREVWLKVIMGEFERDFSRAKWREGYEQGKVEGMIEREKVKIPQFVADWIDVCKNNFGFSLKSALNTNTILHYSEDHQKLLDWIKVDTNQETFARAWLDGYEIEKEPKYTVRVKEIAKYKNYLVFGEISRTWFFANVNSYDVIFKHTRKELEDANFGWVFDCEGIEIEEVE